MKGNKVPCISQFINDVTQIEGGELVVLLMGGNNS